MIDRVELDVVDQLADVGHLDDGDAVRLEQRRDAGDEVVRVRDVRQHVVGVDDVGPAAARHELLGQAAAEEVLDRLHAPRAGRGRGPGVGSMPSTGTPAAGVVLQQVAVVARELDDEARRGRARARAGAPRHSAPALCTTASVNDEK